MLPQYSAGNEPKFTEAKLPSFPGAGQERLTDGAVKASLMLVAHRE